MKQERIQLHESTSKQRTSVAVTVYQERAMIADRRKIKLPKGLSELKYEDVAKTLESESIHIRSITEPEGLSVLERQVDRNYIIDSESLVLNYAGKPVKIRHQNPRTGKTELAAATVHYRGRDSVVYQIGDEIILSPQTMIVLPDASVNYPMKPAIRWLLCNRKATPQIIEAAYMVREVTWDAHYNIVLHSGDTRADIIGWASVANECGLDFVDASIMLVAGDTSEDIRKSHMEKSVADYCRRSPPTEMKSFKEEPFDDYHVYHLTRQGSVMNGQTKRFELLSANDITCRQEYRLTGPDLKYMTDGFDLSGSDGVTRHTVIENRKPHGLGQPLPKGSVTMYKHDGRGGLMFIGEDSIGHVPVDETASVKIGKAFDIVAGRIQTENRRTAPAVHEAAFEIYLRNHKAQNVTVRVLEQIPGWWDIVESTAAHKRLNANWVEWPVKVRHRGNAKLNYRIRIPVEDKKK